MTAITKAQTEENTMEAVTTQQAELRSKDGSTATTVEVPAFPANPDLIVVPEGILTWGLTSTHYFVPNSPVIGYGTTTLSYHEVEAFTPIWREGKA